MIYRVHQCLLAEKLALNKEKTGYMMIGSRQRIANSNNDPTITLGGTHIKTIKETKH